MLELISEGLPKFDPKLAESDADQTGSLSSLEQSVPMVMDPFTVFEARVLDLEKPHENLLEKVEGTDPLYHRVGDSFTSELTFVDLGKASNWTPFSLQPPPAVSLRFTVSW
jgi:hypothetical protein